MSPKSIKSVIPSLVSSLLLGDLITLNGLLDQFPKLINIKDPQGRNILMKAAYSGATQPHIISYLIAFYVIANPIIKLDAMDDNGFTAYDWAVLGNNGFAVSLISKLNKRENENF